MKKPLIWGIGGLVVVAAIVGAVFLISNNNNDENNSNSSSSSTNQDVRAIKPSEVLTLADAEKILGISLQVYGELDEADDMGILKTVYHYDDGNIYPSPIYMIQITLFQTETVNEKELLSNQEKARAGVSFLKNSLDEGVELIVKEDPSNIVWIEGIGDYAKINRSNIHTISVGYKNISFSIVLTGQAAGAERPKEEESAWKVKRLVEAAMLVVKNLDAHR